MWIMQMLVKDSTDPLFWLPWTQNMNRRLRFIPVMIKGNLQVFNLEKKKKVDAKDAKRYCIVEAWKTGAEVGVEKCKGGV